MMRSLYDKLIKILKTEQGKNYTNQAVIGGLEGFLSFWLTDARRAATTSQERAQVEDVAQQLNGYGGLTEAVRAQRVQYLFERLGSGSSGPSVKERSGGESGPADESPRPVAPRVEEKGRTQDEAPGEGGVHTWEKRPRNGTQAAPRGTSEGRPDKHGQREDNGPQGVDGKPPVPAQQRDRTEEPDVALEGARTQPGDTAAPSGRFPAQAAVPPAVARAARQGAEAPRVRPPAALPPFQRRGWSAEEMIRADRELDQSITTVGGIGTVKAEKYQRLGIHSVRDLLLHIPYRYEDYTTLKTINELMYGDEVTVAGVVQDVSLFKTPRGTVTVNAKISDGTGTLAATWFGNKYLINQLPVGSMLRLSGKVDAYLGRLQLSGPRFERIDAEELRNGRLVAIYPLTDGLTEKTITADIGRALDHTAGKVPDPLPISLRESHNLPDLAQALSWIHQPRTLAEVEAARRRLGFDELLRLQLGLLQQRRAWRSQKGPQISASDELLQRFARTLPFELTNAQQRALREILSDMAEPYAMSRLLQGDVGSGKTVVGAAALLVTAAAGYQGALMAPTEILAEQHFSGLTRFLNPPDTQLLGRPIRVALLTGSMGARDKEETRQAIKAGDVDIVVGTHALIQQEVMFARLGLAIVDEQHRFGVQQRGMLRSQASDSAPDLLVMSATPIPRSLALTLYGDLDLSIIDELPPGREPIVTRAITTHQRERAYTYIRRQLSEGRQAFIICPLVEESDKMEAKAAVDEHRFLQEEVFPEFRLELLHGRMRSEDKEEAMGRFYRNESQVLVSTSVVEVGIDVPNATVMLIEGANRFGLAQLHQFRGRIGRGSHRSLCLLMAEETISADGELRLTTLVEHHDGFKLAEQDLAMRGPGDFFGTKQSGLPVLKMAQLGDSVSLHAARTAAADLLARDPDLTQAEHQLMRQHKERYWAGRSGNLS